MNNYLEKAVRLTALASVPAFLLNLAIVPHSATASSFDACASRLLSSGISQENAGIACADALEPKQLSACVDKIQGRTPIAGEDALTACYRVRRPKELASCVVEIGNNIDSTEIATLALDNCRRSLLPERFADCVVGLNDTISELSAPEAIATCISAEDFPRNLFPES